MYFGFSTYISLLIVDVLQFINNKFGNYISSLNDLIKNENDFNENLLSIIRADAVICCLQGEILHLMQLSLQLNENDTNTALHYHSVVQQYIQKIQSFKTGDDKPYNGNNDWYFGNVSGYLSNLFNEKQFNSKEFIEWINDETFDGSNATKIAKGAVYGNKFVIQMMTRSGQRGGLIKTVDECNLWYSFEFHICVLCLLC